MREEREGRERGEKGGRERGRYAHFPKKNKDKKNKPIAIYIEKGIIP
jgi:hypothetical protein